MSWQNILFIIVVLFIAVIVWLCRYDLEAVSASGEGIHGVVYCLDRWTEEVVYMQGGTGGRVIIDSN